MTQGNSLLGKFNEISPMPHDAYDIDVDANGILNVSARTSLPPSQTRRDVVSGQSMNAPNAPCLHGRSARASSCQRAGNSLRIATRQTWVDGLHLCVCGEECIFDPTMRQVA